jgi:hypothetical protein
MGKCLPRPDAGRRVLPPSTSLTVLQRMDQRQSAGHRWCRMHVNASAKLCTKGTQRRASPERWVEPWHVYCAAPTKACGRDVLPCRSVRRGHSGKSGRLRPCSQHCSIPASAIKGLLEGNLLLDIWSRNSNHLKTTAFLLLSHYFLYGGLARSIMIASARCAPALS